MSGTTQDSSPLRETVEQHADELKDAASTADASAGVVVLAAVASGEQPPQWAIDDLEERA